MKKVLICGVIAAAFGMTSAFAAGSAVGNFDVKATVTAKCVTNNPTTAPAVIDFGAVAAFGTGTITPVPTNLTFNCTRGLAITSATLSKTASTVAGLAYTLGVDTGTKAAGSAATSAGVGATADVWTYVVTGSMVSGQAGDTAAATTDSQTLTIAF